MIIILSVIIFFKFFNEGQKEILYRVNGVELQVIKKECLRLARKLESETIIKNGSLLNGNFLSNWGYSEFRGSCFAVIVHDKGRMVYDTTEDKLIYGYSSTYDDLSVFYKHFNSAIHGKTWIIW